jgi:1-acyl-sn-glycerol-3-phosphate acyltransferase
MDREALLDRARGRGVNPVAYWIVRGTLQPFFHVYFRLRRIGREHIPAHGPVILASNHRSFLDPFVIAVMTKRPIYFVAKKELFVNRPIAWLLGALGAFPIDRRGSDQGAMATAREILARGESVLIFPEGTRIRPGALGDPKRGVGRLALESGAPVVPIAVHGTEAVRKGWRIRPHKVSIRAGAPLQFPRIEQPSPQLAKAVTERIWPCVELQWEWLGGTPRLRRAAVIGDGPWGASMAAALQGAGFEVDVRPSQRAGEIELAHHDLVCLATPAHALPRLLAAHGPRIPERAGVLVLSRTLVPPLGTLPGAFVAEHTHARAVASMRLPTEALPLVVACADRAFLTQVAGALVASGFAVEKTSDEAELWVTTSTPGVAQPAA